MKRGSRRSFSWVTLQAAYTKAPASARASPSTGFCACMSVLSVRRNSASDARQSAAPAQCSSLYRALSASQDLQGNRESPLSP